MLIREVKLRIWSQDNSLIFVLFVLLTFAVYILPNNYYSLLIIIPSLFLFLTSRNDYFWLAFFTLIFMHPIGLFSEATRSAVHRLPLFSVMSGFSFSTKDVIVTFIIIKALFLSEMKYNVLGKDIQRIFIYALFLIVIAVIVHQPPMNVMVNQIRSFYYFFLIIGYNNLLRDDKQIYKLMMLLMPFIILQFIDAIYFFSTGEYLLTLINPSHELKYATTVLDAQSGIMSRYLPQSLILILITLLGGLLISTFHRNKTYFLLLAFMSYLVIVFSGTRSWTVIFGLIIIAYIYKNFKTSISYYLIITLIILIPGYFVFNHSRMAVGISTAFQRIETLKSIGHGQNAANQSLEHKMETTLKEDIGNIKKNPLTGWAFTDIKGGEDAGNFGLIAEVGFIGFFLFLVLWTRIAMLLLYGIKHTKWKEIFYVLIFVYVGLLISHFTTNRIFGLFQFPIFISFFIVTINKIWISAHEY